MVIMNRGVVTDAIPHGEDGGVREISDGGSVRSAG
jgi:hypothetical protein